MDELAPLLQFLNKFTPLSQPEFDAQVRPYVVLRRFKPKEVVCATGCVENYFNFLLTGLARAYYRKGDAEIIIQLATEGHLIHAHESFHSRTPSNFTVQTLEPCHFASIPYHGLEDLYTTNSKMQRLGRMVTTYTLILKEQQQTQGATLSPRERFLHFAEKHPDLMQRVPQKYLASYLNIKPETFSRFKHMIKEASPTP